MEQIPSEADTDRGEGFKRQKNVRRQAREAPYWGSQGLRKKEIVRGKKKDSVESTRKLLDLIKTYRTLALAGLKRCKSGWPWTLPSASWELGLKSSSRPARIAEIQHQGNKTANQQKVKLTR